MLNKYLEQTNKEEVKLWINQVLNSYLKKGNEENVGEIEHILDFLNSDRAPKRLKKMSYPTAKVQSEKWVKSLVKKGNNITEVAKVDYKVIKRYSPSGFKFVRLLSENAFKREGNLMSHCVGSYYGRDKVEIYSLRDENDQPHCTIEVQRENNRIQQIKGKGNGSIHPKYIKYVLSIIKYFKMELNEYEMNNLGYTHMDKTAIDFLRENFKVKILKLQDKFYVYNNQKITALVKEEVKS